MYIRFPVIADMCASILGLNRTELVGRLGIALPTLNAYRGVSRFPRDIETSRFTVPLAELLNEAADRLGYEVDSQNYILTSMKINSYLSNMYHNDHGFSMGVLAANIAYQQLSQLEKTDSSITSSQALTFCLQYSRQETPMLVAWLMKKYCTSFMCGKKPSPESPYCVERSHKKMFLGIKEYLQGHEQARSMDKYIELPQQLTYDILMCIPQKLSFSLSMSQPAAHCAPLALANTYVGSQGDTSFEGVPIAIVDVRD